MKLYFAPPSPFVRKTMIIMKECGVFDQIELVETKVVPGDPNLEYGNEVNPLRTIPALITDNGDLLTDSLVICDYLIAEAGNTTLMPSNAAERTRILRNHSIISAATDRAVATRYETAMRPEEYCWPEMVADNKSRIFAALQWLEERPAELDGDFTLAHAAFVSLGHYLDFRFDDWQWRDSVPGLAKRLEGFNERDSVREVYAM